MPLARCESNGSADPQTVDDRIPRGEHVRGHARGDAEDQAPADDLAPGFFAFLQNAFSKNAFSKNAFSKNAFFKILQIFGGLVLGCIKTKFCKKICV